MARTSQAKAAAAATAKRRKSGDTATEQQSKEKEEAQEPEQEKQENSTKGEEEEEKTVKTAATTKQDPDQGKNIKGSATKSNGQLQSPEAEVKDDEAKKQEGKDDTGNANKETSAKNKISSNTTKKRAATKSDAQSSKGDDTKSPPSKKPKREQRQGTRQSSRSTNANAKDHGKDSDKTSSRGKPTKSQLLRYLISPEAEHLCRPDDEEEALKSHTSSSSSSAETKYKTYGGPTPLSPFEELICAMILSRPISHRLGLRTIRTVLNEPYGFDSARTVQDAGDEKRHQALWDARTQHKDKTASQLGLAGDVVLEKYCHGAAGGADKGKAQKSARKSGGGGGGGAGEDAEGKTLAGLVAQSEHDIDDLLATLQSDIKGFGKTTAAIFRRRMQWMWEFAYPYVDERTADGLKDLGLPIRAEPLVELVETYWGDLKDSGGGKSLAGDDEETRKRRAFTIVLERATNARLEGKVGDVLAAAAKS